MATKAQLIEQLAAANDNAVRMGRTIEELRTQIAKLRPVGYSQPNDRSAFLTADYRRLIAPAYFEANPNARSATDKELSDWAKGQAL